jgi:hypothetical protein
MNPELTYPEAIAKADALKSIGCTSLYLMRDQGEKPWAFVTKVEPGCSHRLEIATSVSFTAIEPTTGLEFRWSEDIEDQSANGKGSYEIAAQHCRAIMSKLAGQPRAMFAAYLSECARKVHEKGNEWQAITDRQFRDAAVLALLALNEPPASEGK